MRLKMKGPFGPWQEYLTTLTIFPREALAKLGLDGLARAPVGTGPYKVTELSPGRSIVLQRFDKYFGGAKGQPSIERITFRRIPDAETQIAELMAGNLDFIWRLTQDQADQLQAMPELKVTAGGTIRIGYVSMDAAGRTGSDDPFTKLEVRRAVAHAIDREGLVQNLAGEGAEVIDTPATPSSSAATPSRPCHYDYDPAKAKALLAQAGYPDGFDVDLIAYRDRPWTEAIIGDLRKVGIRAKLNWVQADTSTSQTRAGKVRMNFGAWGSTSIYDVAASTSHFFTKTADDQARDETVAKLLEEGDHSLGPGQAPRRLRPGHPPHHRAGLLGADPGLSADRRLQQGAELHAVGRRSAAVLQLQLEALRGLSCGISLDVCCSRLRCCWPSRRCRSRCCTPPAISRRRWPAKRPRPRT